MNDTKELDIKAMRELYDSFKTAMPDDATHIQIKVWAGIPKLLDALEAVTAERDEYKLAFECQSHSLALRELNQTIDSVTAERDHFKLLLEQAVESGGLDRPYAQTYTSKPNHELRAWLRERALGEGAAEPADAPPASNTTDPKEATPG